MNNNRSNNNNNRRRGRGNNNRQQGGGQQLNRVDSRARGNAPQMLEKYRKLALDAHLNDDRVTEEYYLQFADHYFRVLADQRQRQDEQRQPPRRDDRMGEYGDDYANDDDDAEGSGERGQQAERAPSQDRNDRNERGQDRGERGQDQRGQGQGGQGQGGQDRGQNRDQGREQSRDFDRDQNRGPGRNRNRAPEESQVVAADEDQTEGEGERSLYEPADNPFVRDNRATRAAPKPRKPRRRTGEDEAGETTGFDAAILPPSISTQAEPAAPEPVAEAVPEKRTRKAAAKPVEVAETVAGDEEKPKRRRTRKAASSGDESGETLETAN